MLVITAGFSFGALSEQNKEYNMTELNVSSSERILCGNNPDDNTLALSYVIDTLDQQQSLDSGVSYTISENGYYAQSFIPTLGQLTKVELKLFKKGSPSGLSISVRSSLTGVDLTSKYLSGTSISTNATWTEFNFPDITVTPGDTYYIVWDPIGVPDFNNNFYWSIGTSNPYANGLAWKFLGSIWEIHNPTTYPNPDFCFKTYGISGGGNNPPNKPTTPSGPTTGSVGETLHYESYISDPDGDGLEVYFDWGDGTYTGWIGILTNGTVGNYKTWSSAATYQVRVKTRDTPYLAESPWSNSLSVTINDAGNFAPHKPSTPSGPSSGSIGVSYTYSSTTTDPESHQIYYWFDWDDGTNSGWIGPYNSGDICLESHVWSVKGSYT
ncbi:MAG: hypothetical protein V1769_07270, partial [Thermoplasmatota archaeon]